MIDPIARLREQRDEARAAAAIAEAQNALLEAHIEEQQERLDTLLAMCLDAADQIAD